MTARLIILESTNYSLFTTPGMARTFLVGLIVEHFRAKQAELQTNRQRIILPKALASLEPVVRERLHSNGWQYDGELSFYIHDTTDLREIVDTKKPSLLVGDVTHETNATLRRHFREFHFVVSKTPEKKNWVKSFVSPIDGYKEQRSVGMKFSETVHVLHTAVDYEKAAVKKRPAPKDTDDTEIGFLVPMRPSRMVQSMTTKGRRGHSAHY